MFNVSVPNVDETPIPGETPAEYVLRLARSKAQATAHLAHRDQIVIAADTTVVDGNTILGKPADLSEATAMLQQLRGRTHQVYTGLAVLRVADHTLLSDLCITDVPMRAYTDEEIEAYVQSGDPLDKAGAYAIQHPGFQPVESMSGCYASVMGLPLCHLIRLLRQWDLQPMTDLPKNCQTFLNYSCPVSQRILRGEQIG
jgi:MAF protein